MSCFHLHGGGKLIQSRGLTVQQIWWRKTHRCAIKCTTSTWPAAAARWRMVRPSLSRSSSRAAASASSSTRSRAASPRAAARKRSAAADGGGTAEGRCGRRHEASAKGIGTDAGAALSTESALWRSHAARGGGDGSATPPVACNAVRPSSVLLQTVNVRRITQEIVQN